MTWEKDEKIDNVAEVLQFVDTTGYPNLAQNAIKTMGFDLNDFEQVGIVNKVLLAIYNKQEYEVARKANDTFSKKALQFYTENEKEILEDIRDEANAINLTDKEMHDLIYSYSRAETQSEKQEALAKYALFRIAQHFDAIHSYDDVMNEYIEQAKELFKGEKDENDRTIRKRK